jgi:hypothetical protein
MIWECASEWHFEASGIVDKQRSSGQIDSGIGKRLSSPWLRRHSKKQRKDKKQRDYERQQEGGKQQEKDHNPSDNDAETRKLVRRLEVWHQCVDEFSKRTLTVLSDKLPAMAGLAAVINDGDSRRIPRRNMEQEHWLRTSLGKSLFPPEPNTSLQSAKLELGQHRWECEFITPVLARYPDGRSCVRPKLDRSIWSQTHRAPYDIAGPVESLHGRSAPNKQVIDKIQ